jgi:RNAse (barnase) inhibitor barstar
MATIKISNQIPEIENETFSVTLDGKKIKSLRNFYNTISEALYFPEYFDPNLDGLYDCLTDLSWLQNHKILIIIKNYDYFLLKSKRAQVIKVFEEAMENQTEDKVLDIVGVNG